MIYAVQVEPMGGMGEWLMLVAMMVVAGVLPPGSLVQGGVCMQAVQELKYAPPELLGRGNFWQLIAYRDVCSLSFFFVLEAKLGAWLSRRKNAGC